MSEQDRLTNAAIARAEEWQRRANELLRPKEKKIQSMMKRLLTHPGDKITLLRMMDESFRSNCKPRVAERMHAILQEKGIPEFFTSFEKSMLGIFSRVGRHIPKISVPSMIKQIRKESSIAVVPGEKQPLKAHMDRRKAEGVRMNVNHIGEVVLGEKEAQARLDDYVKDLEDDNFEYISVKISTIYSQISSLAIDQTVEELKKRLIVLYRAAKNNHYTRKDGTRVIKFVNLDMEEYRDLELTARAFMETLDLDEFKDFSAGIVLQAYLPDSYHMQRTIVEWAQKRVAAGGAPVKMRLVKGANLEMEYVESALHGWPLAPYDNKPEVDANFKRMTEYALRPENAKVMNLGLASHNLFELAYAYEVAKANDTLNFFGFEMLEGMADHVRRAIAETSTDVLLYAPIATHEQFINAIAYLVRRLDENTGEQNFLRYANDLQPGSGEWEFLKEGYLTSLKLKESARTTPNRVQNRLTESWENFAHSSYDTKRFINEPDTDWALAANRQWAETIRSSWMFDNQSNTIKVPAVVDGEELFEGKKIKDAHEPSLFDETAETNILSSRYALADNDDAERALATASADPDGWRDMSWDQRHQILAKVANEIRMARADLIGAAAAGCGKLVTETDVEVSEAVDFAEFYPHSATKLAELTGVNASGKGVGLVISPWNFPVAIPCGGIVASLAAGNTVIFKPASDAVLPAWILCNCFWRAGVSKKTLQFMPCAGSSTGAKLAADPRVSYVILTGGTDTGLSLLEAIPQLALSAETGGKDATIVTSMADKDQAVKNIVYSAFGNSGQKCSATSLLILERDVYEDAHFRKALVDAAQSWEVGSAWNYKNSMATLIKPPSGDLKRALTSLEPSEEWALQPRQLGDNPYLWSPGIKYGVQPGSYTHMTEFFGPVLAVICAENLDHAIELVNQTGFGLTSGIETLDDREQEIWKERIKAGNLYINRGTTGAIVLRQPFGGMGASAIGSGIKAGGYNYVSQFMNFSDGTSLSSFDIQHETHLYRCCQDLENKNNWGGYDNETAATIDAFVATAYNYMGWWEKEFSIETDHFRLRGQDNITRYLSIGEVVIRATADDNLHDILAMCAAATITGNRVTLSLAENLGENLLSFINSADGHRLLRDVTIVTENDQQLCARVSSADRIRYSRPELVPAELFTAAAKSGFYIARTPLCREGRIELLQYLCEQSICNTYHRYGNLKERGLL